MNASLSLPLLERARVASPCPMKWEDLAPTGQDAMRHCDACDLNVYNFADLSGEEAERLIRTHVLTGERLCGTIWRRADGTIITKNCPVGWRAARQRTVRAASRLAAAIGLFLTGGLVVGAQRADRWPGLARVRSLQPFRTVSEWISPASPPPPGQIMVMGDICVMPTPVTPPSGGTTPVGESPDEEAR